MPVHVSARRQKARLPRSSVQGGADVIRKEAWPFYRTISGVRLCWELEEPKGPKGPSAPISAGFVLGQVNLVPRGTSLKRSRPPLQGYLAHKKTSTPLGPP